MESRLARAVGCLRGVGIELAHMAASRPRLLWVDLHLAGSCPHQLPLHRAALPKAPALDAAERTLLGQDRRRRGEHRPRRLTLGRWDHFPYVFHQVRLPGPGLLLPATGSGSPLAALRLVFWIHLYDPMPWPPIVYLLGSDPRPHPCIPQVRWVRHRHWTLAHALAPYRQVCQERDHGRMVKVVAGWGA